MTGASEELRLALRLAEVAIRAAIGETDPIGPEDDLNLYQFVLGDPVGNVDEDGLDTTETTRGGFKPVYEKQLPERYQTRLDALSDEDKGRYNRREVRLVPPLSEKAKKPT